MHSPVSGRDTRGGDNCGTQSPVRGIQHTGPGDSCPGNHYLDICHKHTGLSIALCAASCPRARPWRCPVPGPRSAGAGLHTTNEVRHPVLWLKTMPASFTRPPPTLTVRSQDTTRDSPVEAHAAIANIQTIIV